MSAKQNLGDKLTDADYEKVASIEKGTKQIKTSDDPRFGHITMIQDPKSRTVYAVKERKVTDRAEAGRLIQAARNRLTMRNPNLINLVDYSVHKQSELCSSFYILKYFYEFPKTDLRKMQLDREKQGQTFNSAELTNILYQQIQAQSFLQSKGLAHGEVQPLLIGYDPEKKESKLIDKNDLNANEASIIQLQKNHVLSSGNQALYQSPAVYSNLKKGNLKFNFDKNKEDAFALGLVLLEAGNGKKIDNIYDAKSGTVNNQALSNHVDDFKRKFEGENALLTTTVASLVNTNENERPTPAQVQANLPPYEKVQAYLESGQGTSYLQGGNSSTYSVSGTDSHTHTQTIIEGGQEKIIHYQKEHIPDVDTNLFDFDPSNNPFAKSIPVMSYHAVDNQPQEFTVQPTKYVFKGNESQTQNTYNPNQQQQQNYDNVTEDYQSFRGNQNQNRVHTVQTANKDEVLVYAEEDNYPQTQYQQSIYQPTHDNRNYNSQVEHQKSHVAYSEPAVQYVNQSYSTNSYPNQSINHEFRLHDSTVTRPQVITSDNSYAQNYQTRSSHNVYVSPQSYQPETRNVVYQEAPAQTFSESAIRHVSYSQAPTETTYKEAPRSTIVYQNAPSQTVYSETPRSTVVYSNAPTETIYREAPVQTVYKTHQEPIYTTQYLQEAPVYNDVVYANEQIGSRRSNRVQSTTNITYANQNNFDTTGLKLVKTYTDNTHATDQRNY